MKFVQIILLFLCVFVYAENPFLIRTEADALASPHDNLKTGVPCFCGIIADRSGYAVCFSTRYRQPIWVKYKLTREEALAHLVMRSNIFRIDPDISFSLTPGAFAGSGYDRGHLVPAGDMTWSADAMADSFLMTNMVLQHPSCNRRTWLSLEDLTRSLAVRDGFVIVTSGVTSFRAETVNSLHIPSAFFKILQTPSETRAYLVPNCASDLTPADMLISSSLAKLFFRLH